MLSNPLQIEDGYIHDESSEMTCGLCDKFARFRLVGPRGALELCDDHLLGLAMGALNRWAQAEDETRGSGGDTDTVQRMP